MNAQSILSEKNIAAWLLILCGVVFLVGGILYMGRAMLQWPAAASDAYLVWERGSIIAAVLINVLGLGLLEGLLRTAGDPVFARVGLIMTLVAVAVVVTAEASFISRGGQAYSQIVIYVVLAFLAQAAIGVSLLRTDLLAGWIGWATIIWNLAWLIVLPLVSPRDIYYPVLHHTVPVLIGIALLLKQ
jgi:hypothetical protein